MPNYRAPGIYVEEVPGGARPIGAVGTSTAAFLGAAPDGAARLNEAVAVNNWSDFLRIFAGQEGLASTPLALSVYGFFANGGGRCYIVNVGPGNSIAGGGRRRSGIDLLDAIDDISIVAAPAQADPASWEALLGHCERLGDRVAILDPPAGQVDVDALIKVATPASGGGGRRGAGGAAAAEREAGAEAEPAEAEPPAPLDGGRPRQSDYGAFYFPWLRAYDPLSGEVVDTPPSGHLAGVWARTDTERGVHKAPANQPIAGGVVDLAYRVTRQEQEVLNPAGVNCIRFFPETGIRVWGARTLAAEASESRYLNVRRLMNMLKESIAEGTRWIVFEPNDAFLWGSINREISNFLTRVWRDGALFGRTARQAFFVKCDEETNPPEVRDAGEVVVLIGVAPVKPAEFVVFKISQSMGGTQTEVEG